jgi:hypothetical protein
VDVACRHASLDSPITRGIEGRLFAARCILKLGLIADTHTIPVSRSLGSFKLIVRSRRVARLSSRLATILSSHILAITHIERTRSVSIPHTLNIMSISTRMHTQHALLLPRRVFS